MPLIKDVSGQIIPAPSWKQTIQVVKSEPHAAALMLVLPSFARRQTVRVMRELGECVWTAPDLARSRYADLVLG